MTNKNDTDTVQPSQESSQAYLRNLEPWLLLNRTRGIGPKTSQRLLEYFLDPDTILNASIAELKNAGLSQKVAKELKNPDKEGLDADLAWLESHKHHLILTQDDQRYPQLLRELADPPLVLYISGDPDWLALPQLAIVGSRSATKGGLRTAEDFAAELAGLGLVIVSGLALGIDAAAHRGALKSGGRTIAVLGTGPDRIYPARHLELAQEIISSGIIISEFVPGSKLRKENFPRRNRLISGLSTGTLVIEATRKSGSLITARFAMEQGREVFAVPGSIRNPYARGCHSLIRDGAKLVESVEDIIEELQPLVQLSLQQNSENPKEQQENPKEQQENPQEQQENPKEQQENPKEQQQEEMNLSGQSSHHVLECLGYDPTPFDELIQRTGLTTSELSSMLLSLELEGYVTSQAGSMYVRNK